MTSEQPISEDDLQGFVDGALDVRRREEVEAYLAETPEVSERVRALVDQRDALRETLSSIAREPTPPELDLARLIEARRRPDLPSWRVAAAAAVLLMAGAAGGWIARGASDDVADGPLDALARDASYSFATFASDRVRPVEIKAEESAALTKWVSNRLKRPVSALDLSAAGYRFMGGRVVPTESGPAGLFMYDDKSGARLVMLMRPLGGVANQRFSERASGSFAWAKDGMGYSLAGPGGATALKPVVEEIRRQADLGV